jgi:hypothetical protein
MADQGRGWSGAEHRVGSRPAAGPGCARSARRGRCLPRAKKARSSGTRWTRWRCCGHTDHVDTLQLEEAPRRVQIDAVVDDQAGEGHTWPMPPRR